MVGAITGGKRNEKRPEGVHLKNRTRKSVAATCGKLSKTAWDLEREALEQDFGSLFAISGLMLATDE